MYKRQDWGGSNDHVKGVMCQSDLEMPAPGLDSARELVTAVNEGRLSMKDIDLCVDHVCLLYTSRCV